MATSISPRRLLLIDDSQAFRHTLAEMLRAAGHIVQEAETGAAGLALLRAEPVEVVLTDVEMPGLTGWDVALLVKAKHPRLPVVLLMGADGSDVTRCQRRALVDAVLQKPFQFNEIQSTISKLTKTRHGHFVPSPTRVSQN